MHYLRLFRCSIIYHNPLRHDLFLPGNPGHSSGPVGADSQRSSRIRTDRRKEKQTGTDQERSGNVRSFLFVLTYLIQSDKVVDKY